MSKDNNKKWGRFAEDLTGKQFNYLIAIKNMGVDKRGHALWKCECTACGGEKVVHAGKLKSGEIKSCGCMHRFYSHHQTDTRLYHIWCTMKARCNRPSSHKYKNYGGRGIKLCQEWNKFENFYEWAMSHGYQEHLSIDRIDNDGNYEPDNCRWATAKQQANNTRSNKKYTYKGESLTLAELSTKYGVKYNLLSRRINRGWNIEDAIETPKLGGHDLKEYKASLEKAVV